MTRKIAGVESFKAAREVILRNKIFCGLIGRFDESLLGLKRSVLPELNICYGRPKNITPFEPSARSIETEVGDDRIRDFQGDDLKLYEWVSKNYFEEQMDLILPEVRWMDEQFNAPSKKNVNWAIVYRNVIYKPLRRVRDNFKRDEFTS